MISDTRERRPARIASCTDRAAAAPDYGWTGAGNERARLPRPPKRSRPGQAWRAGRTARRKGEGGASFSRLLRVGGFADVFRDFGYSLRLIAKNIWSNFVAGNSGMLFDLDPQKSS
jgi:hypothetical protein